MLLNHTDEKLVRMANQIATFFLSQPEDIRIEGVATHINKFWEPRMRRRFFEMVDAGAGDFLPLVLAASKKIKRPDDPASPFRSRASRKAQRLERRDRIITFSAGRGTFGDIGVRPAGRT